MFYANANQSSLIGGAGLDTVNYGNHDRALLIDLGFQQTSDGISGDFLNAIENAVGSRFDDTLIVGAVAGRLAGREGNDVFVMSANESTLFGGPGIDTVSYEHADRAMTIDLNARRSWNGTSGDTLNSIENAIGSRFDDTFTSGSVAGRLEGRDGNDFFIARANQSGLEGGSGSDTVTYENHDRGVLIDLGFQQTGDGISGDFLNSIENAVGSRFDDTFVSGYVAGRLKGRDGNDVFYANANLSGFEGGAGFDTVTYENHNRGVLIDLGFQQTSDGISGDFLNSIEHAIASSFDDMMISGYGATHLEGRGGNDFLIARANQSTLDGGSGVDLVSYEYVDRGLFIDLQAQMTSNGTNGDFLSSIENAFGSDYNDLFQGQDGVDNAFTGRGGSDTYIFRANAGHDVFADFHAAGADRDYVAFGAGIFRNNDPLLDARDLGGGGVVLTALDQSSITLYGVQRSDMSGSNFALR